METLSGLVIFSEEISSRMMPLKKYDGSKRSTKKKKQLIADLRERERESAREKLKIKNVEMTVYPMNIRKK